MQLDEPLKRSAAAGVAARVDPDEGIREETGYFGPEGDRLFGVRYLPASGMPTHGVVICSPFHAESNTRYRWEVLLARSLAARGLAVQRFDYRGTGLSDGDITRLTFERMRDDALRAAAFLRRGCGVARVGFVGPSFGGLVAAAAARACGDAPLVLRGATLEGHRYFREAFRAQMISAMRKGGQDYPSSEALVEELRRDGVVDILGNLLPRSFYETALDRSLLGTLGDRSRPVLILEGTTDGGPSEAIRRFARSLEEAHFDVEVLVEPIKESFWLIGTDFRPVEESPEVRGQLERVAEWLERKLGEVGPSEDQGADPGIEGWAEDHGRREQPVFIPAGEETLFGLLGQPQAPANGVGVIVLHAGNYTISTHRNLLWRQVSERLTGAGFHTLRFDYHGVGSSTGVSEEFLTHRPFVSDAEAAVTWMESLGVTRIVLAGECYGARTALSHAPDVEGLEGLFLIAPTLRDRTLAVAMPTEWAKSYGLATYLRKAFTLETLRGLGDPVARRAYFRIAKAKVAYLLRRLRRRPQGTDDVSWVTGRFLAPLERVVDRGVPVRFVYGTTDGIGDFERAKAGRLGELLRRPGVGWTILEGKVHAAGTRVATQREIVELIDEWARRLVDQR